MKKKATQEQVDALQKQVNELTVMVYAIAQAASVVPIRVREQKPFTKWVRQDSEEWKQEVERTRQEGELLKAMQHSPQPYFMNPQGPYPGETIFGNIGNWSP